MIDDVLLQWHKMSGLTDKHKQVNALLTAAFILRWDMPRDECLIEAVELVDLQRKSSAWPDSGAYLLKQRFATAAKADGTDRMSFPRWFPICDRTAGFVDIILTSEEPLTGEALVNLLEAPADG